MMFPELLGYFLLIMSGLWIARQFMAEYKSVMANWLPKLVNNAILVAIACVGIWLIKR